MSPRGGSWYQAEPRMSVALIEALDVATDTPVIDVGGGSSRLVDELIQRGFSDISVLDVSAQALHLARSRLGEAASRVRWLREDLLEWEPPRAYGLWHDRALFHFLVEPEQRGKGHGKALLQSLAKLAVERGCARLEWAVLNWNKPAIDFYNRLGAVPMNEWTVFRVTGEALERLANEKSTK